MGLVHPMLSLGPRGKIQLWEPLVSQHMCPGIGRAPALLTPTLFLLEQLISPLTAPSSITSDSHIQLSVTAWTVAHQAPLSVRFPRLEYSSRVTFPPPGHLSLRRTQTSHATLSKPCSLHGPLFPLSEKKQLDSLEGQKAPAHHDSSHVPHLCCSPSLPVAPAWGFPGIPGALGGLNVQ